MRHEVQSQVAFCLLASLVLAAAASAQNAPIPVTVRDSDGGFNTGPVLPVGLSVPARVMKRQLKLGKHIPSAEKQIRIILRYVMLDAETRKTIYQDLGTDQLKTFGSQVPILQAEFAGAESADTRGTEVIGKSSRVTTSVLDSEQLNQLLQAVAADPDSQITRAPSVVLIDGEDTEVTDLVQRPFVVDLQRQGKGETQAVNSVVQVLNEGISIRLNAALTPSQRIHVASDILFEKILDVEQEEVFGIGDGPTTVQVPVHQRKAVAATENLEIGQTLLIDPYVKHERTKSVTVGIPILSSIPYISDSFSSTETVTLQQQMIILIQPTMEAETKPPLPR